MAGHVGGDQVGLRADAGGQQDKDNHSPDKSFRAHVSPNSVWRRAVPHGAEPSNPCGVGSIILLRQRMTDVQYSRRPARQRAAMAPDISIVVTASTPTCATKHISAAWSYVVEIWIMPPIMVTAFADGPPSTKRRRPQHANTPRRTTGSPRQPEGIATFSGGPCATFDCCATALERLQWEVGRGSGGAYYALPPLRQRAPGIVLEPYQRQTQTVRSGRGFQGLGAVCLYRPLRRTCCTLREWQGWGKCRGHTSWLEMEFGNGGAPYEG